MKVYTQKQIKKMYIESSKFVRFENHEALEAENANLKEALIKHGMHLRGCYVAKGHKCNCGLSELID